MWAVLERFNNICVFLHEHFNARTLFWTWLTFPQISRDDHTNSRSVAEDEMSLIDRRDAASCSGLYADHACYTFHTFPSTHSQVCKCDCFKCYSIIVVIFPSLMIPIFNIVVLRKCGITQFRRICYLISTVTNFVQVVVLWTTFVLYEYHMI